MTMTDSAPMGAPSKQYSEADLLGYFNTSAAKHRHDSASASEAEKREHSRGANKVFNSTVSAKTDSEIVNAVRNLFQDARAFRRPLVAKWNKHHRMLRGRYWEQNNRAQWMPSPEVPEIFPIVRSHVGWMTDRRFKNTVSVASAPFSTHSEFWSKVALDLETTMESTWQVNKEEAEITKSLWDAATFGTGVIKTTWDNSLAGGMGDAKMKRIDPYGFYPDPAALDCEDGNYYIEVKQMSLQELDRRFPGSWDKFGMRANIVEDFDQVPNMNQGTGQVPRANPAAMAGGSGAYGRPGGPGQLSARNIEDDGVTVFECWVREHEFYDVQMSDPEKGEFTEKHVWDSWRVYVVAGNHVLLNMRAEDIWQHGKHPYSRYVPYDLGEFWGVSLVGLLTSSQEQINRLLAAAIHQIELTGNPVLLEDKRAGISRTQVINKPGMRLEKGPGDVKWMEPPKIQGDIVPFLNYFLARMEAVSGLSAITKGATPSGRPAEGTMDAVQEAAFVGIRMALRSLEYTLRDAGTKKASLIVENYTVPRMVAITGNSGERSTLSLRSHHFMVPTDGGNAPMEYTLGIDGGAGSDTSRKVREEKAITLFTLGALDFMSLLEALNWPNREEVYKRVMAQQQAGMEPPGKRERARA